MVIFKSPGENEWRMGMGDKEEGLMVCYCFENGENINKKNVCLGCCFVIIIYMFCHLNMLLCSEI